jgi:flagellar hook-associated protein 2
MATSSIGPTYDPPSTAAALAEKYTAARQQILNSQSSQASATAKGLNDLGVALRAFQSSLIGMTDYDKTMFSQAATFSDTTVATASAKSSAAAGSYSLFVETIATASQVAYTMTDGALAAGDSFDIKFGTTPLTITLPASVPAGKALTTRELAAAINAAPGSSARVSASVVTGLGPNGTDTQLILTAKTTGTANQISIDPAATPAFATATTLVTADDAKLWLGAKGMGDPIVQGSNTFTNIDGVTMTFSKTTAAPVTLTVAPDSVATNAKVKGFIDSYNDLKKVIDAMVDPGDPATGRAGGVFAHDSGVKALQGRLVGMLRGGAAGSASLAAYGITASRGSPLLPRGLLELDTARLAKALAADPTGLDKLIGSTSAANPSGIAHALDVYLKEWSSGLNGQIKTRTTANDKLLDTVTTRQAQLDSQYDAAYKRYLLQFTKLQNLQSQMSNNSSLFDALFGDKSK